MPRLKRKRRGGKVRGGKRRKGRERIGNQGKGFSDSRAVEIRTCFGVMQRRKRKTLQVTIHKGDTHLVIDRGVGQFEIA
jgi:hypothetical protein